MQIIFAYIYHLNLTKLFLLLSKASLKGITRFFLFFSRYVLALEQNIYVHLF